MKQKAQQYTTPKPKAAIGLLTVSEWPGIDGIDADSAAKTEYYNLQGVRVANPSDGGVYIIRRGNTVSKEIVSKKIVTLNTNHHMHRRPRTE